MNINILDKLNIKDKKTSIFIVCIVCVSVLLDLKFLLFPQCRVIGRLNPQIKALQQDIILIKKDMVFFDTLHKKYEDTAKRAQAYSKQIISEGQISTLLEEISKIAKGQGIKIMQIKAMRDRTEKPVTEMGQDKYYSLPISLEMRSGYHSLGLFLNKIETHDRFMRVISLDIAPDTTNYYNHLIKLTLETYLVVQGQ